MEKTAEQRFIELIGEYTVELSINSFPHEYIVKNKEGDLIIRHDQKNKWTDISYIIIWSVFQKEYGMKYKDIQSLMKNLLLKHFKIEGTTPEYY